MDPSAKRPRAVEPSDGEEADGHGEGPSTLRSLTHPVSPPRKRSRQAERQPAAPEGKVDGRTFKSPFRLTRIRDLPAESNVETVGLRDVLGDPLIAECWDFNYLHDIDFLMAAFDEDIRPLVKVHVVHGFWKREDASNLGLQVCRSLDACLVGLEGCAACACLTRRRSLGASLAVQKCGVAHGFHARDVRNAPLQDVDSATARRHGTGGYPHGQHDSSGLDQHDTRRLVFPAITFAQSQERRATGCRCGFHVGRKR